MTLREKIDNFLDSMKDFIESGFVILEHKDYYDRLCICSTCPLKTKDWTCSSCGCNLLVKAKLGSSKCPEGKWKEINKDGNCGC